MGGPLPDQRQEYVIYDLTDCVVRQGLEGHHHLVAGQIQWKRRDPGGKTCRIDLSALNGTSDDGMELATVHNTRPYVGKA